MSASNSDRKRRASWELDSDDFTCSVCLGKKILRPKVVGILKKEPVWSFQTRALR